MQNLFTAPSKLWRIQFASIPSFNCPEFLNKFACVSSFAARGFLCLLVINRSISRNKNDLTIFSLQWLYVHAGSLLHCSQMLSQSAKCFSVESKWSIIYKHLRRPSITLYTLMHGKYCFVIFFATILPTTPNPTKVLARKQGLAHLHLATHSSQHFTVMGTNRSGTTPRHCTTLQSCQVYEVYISRGPSINQNQWKLFSDLFLSQICSFLLLFNIYQVSEDISESPLLPFLLLTGSNML